MSTHELEEDHWMSCATKCPDSEDGKHLMRDEGYNLPLYGHRFACLCGLWQLGRTDENRHNHMQSERERGLLS